ncbi:MAG: endonuclease III [Holosporales bacterium]|jgi:endonuclease-3|nr:endonuclease III [Holosporales bacterium]
MQSIENVTAIFEALSQNIKNPTTELQFVNDYTFCIAVILSAQAKDSAVNKITKSLFDIADNPYDMIELNKNIVEIIRSIGLYNSKAKNIMLFSREIIDRFDGKIPQNRNELEKLSGIGRKSANVIANTLFRMPFIAVDTHVLRVSKRLGLTNSSSPTAVESDLIKKVPLEYHINASNLLVLHGRYVCIAKNPKCSECVVKHLCPHTQRSLGQFF